MVDKCVYIMDVPSSCSDCQFCREDVCMLLNKDLSRWDWPNEDDYIDNAICGECPLMKIVVHNGEAVNAKDIKEAIRRYYGENN